MFVRRLMKHLIPILLLTFSGPALSNSTGKLLACEFDTGGVIKIQIHDEFLNPFLGIPKVTVITESEGLQGYTYVSDESYTVAIPKDYKKSIKDVSHTISIDRKNGLLMFLKYRPDSEQPMRRNGICANAS